jgi:hypothetical protein
LGERGKDGDENEKGTTGSHDPPLDEDSIKL